MLSNGKLKEKRGKTLPIKANKHICYKELLEQARSKWRDFHQDLYYEGAEYVLLYEDGQEAAFLPGSSKEFFSLAKYKEAVLKDYKRISLFLCTVDDLQESMADSDADDEEKESDSANEHSLVRKRKSESNTLDTTEPPNKQRTTVTNQSTISIDPGPSCSNASSTASVNDGTDFSWFYYDEIDRLYGTGDSPHTNKVIEPSKDLVPGCDVDIIKSLQKKVIVDGKKSLYIVIRRGATLDRVLTLWRRAATKVNPDHVLRVKFIGEDGIDDGALAQEFLASTVAAIGQKYFPEGNPLFSTNDIKDGNYKTIGEVIAVSLSQSGPPPSFLDPNVYDSLVSDVDLSSDNIDKHLTQTELDTLQQIKENVSSHIDLIIEHGYTGVVNNCNIDSIVDAVAVSMLSKRAIVLKEFQKGMELFGLAAAIKKYPKVARSLFVMGQQKEVDADYLFSLMEPNYSGDGTSRRQIEEQLMDFFQDFVFKLENETVSGYSEALAWKGESMTVGDDDDGSIDRFNTPDMTPASVLGWLTGQRHRDLVEKKPIYVRFDHECLKRNPQHKVCYPRVGACAREITFPVVHMANADSFKEVFLMAFCKGQAFSKV